MPIIVHKFLLGRRFSGMVLWPFIILRRSELRHNDVFMNHEKIHWYQQLELLVIPFYILYGLEYGLRLLQYKDRHIAYRNISFEREAYQNEHNMKYLEERRFWNFLRYF